MSNSTVKFLGNEYTIPNDVLTYMDLVSFANGIRDCLISSFNKQIARDIAVLEKLYYYHKNGVTKFRCGECRSCLFFDGCLHDQWHDLYSKYQSSKNPATGLFDELLTNIIDVT